MERDMDWDEIVEDIGPRLYRYFCARFTDSQADDLTQETLIRLFRKVDLGQFDPRRGNLQMLSFGIAHYVALENISVKNEFLTEDLGTLSDLEDETGNPETLLLNQEHTGLIKKFLPHLTLDQQNVLTLMIDQDLNLSEISAILNCPEGTVKSHVHRAKKALRRLLQTEVAT